ncbi:calcium-binding protein [Sphingobium sp. WCS2017Hpa-17]|uniref:beta strand repeat-containing protein n=1 Tax=Sphingobium sp. WCS2017Hpa-17 TaxID=3073638 RepID=UPI002889DE38|nr:calcium-binding protein [Sphingobium sp. WCS2017Hpa-17]
MATFTSSPNVDDNFVGTRDDADIFLFHVGHLNSRDRVVGGFGPAQDRLTFQDSGTIYADSLAGISGIEIITLANGTNRLSLTEQMGETAYNRTLTVIGNDGDDTINAYALDEADIVDFTAGLGNDSLVGGAGRNLFRIAANALDAGDNVLGHGWGDELIFSTPGQVNAADLANVTGVEFFRLANGDNSFTVAAHLANTVAYGRILSIVGNDGNDLIDASAVKAGDKLYMSGGGGDDTLIGGSGENSFGFSPSELNSADTVRGQGTLDILVFTASGAIYGQNLAGVSGIDKVILADGGNHISLTEQMASTAFNRTIVVESGYGDYFVNAWGFSADSHLEVIARFGKNTLIGGAGDDIFRVRDNTLDQYSTISGGDGYDRLILWQYGGLSSQWSTNISGIEQIEIHPWTRQLNLTEKLASTALNRTITIVGIENSEGDHVINAWDFSAASHLDAAAGLGNDTLIGGAGDDIFRFAGNTLTQNDTLSARGGHDRLILTSAGNVYSQSFAGVSGIEQIELANGANRLSLTEQLAVTALNRTITVIGNGGDDVINAWGFSAASHLDAAAGLGDDTLIGGAGDDIFRFAGNAFTQYDSVSGRGGFDRLILTSAGSLYGQSFANVSGIEQVELANGANRLNLTDQLAATALNRTITVIGNDGDDIVNAYGFSATSHLDAAAGLGNDTLIGGAGDDIFRFAANALTQYDSVSGRGGFDRLIFTSAGTVYGQSFAGVSGIEQIELANGANRLSLTDQLASSAQNRTLTVIGNDGDDVINAWGFSATNRLDAYAGAGNDTLIGGAGDDIFRFDTADLTANDIVSGGGGKDTLILSGTGALAADAFAHVTGIETIIFSDLGITIDISDSLVNSLSGRVLTINGGAGNDVINASAVARFNRVVATGGAGDDVFIGSARYDSFDGGAGADTFIFRTDQMRLADPTAPENRVLGGNDSSIDRLILAQPGIYTAGQYFGEPGDLKTVSGFEEIHLADGTNDVTLPYYIGNSVVNQHIGLFGGTGNDRIDASGVSYEIKFSFDSGTGDDTLLGGRNANVFLFAIDELTAGDVVTGGSGKDRITFTTAGSIALEDWKNVRGIEEVELAEGSNNIVLQGTGSVWTTTALTVISKNGDDVIDASDFLYTALTIESGSGQDHFIGGEKNDNFRFSAADFDNADILQGNGGVDRLTFTTVVDLSTALWNPLSDINEIELAYGANRLILTNDMISREVSQKMRVLTNRGDDYIDASALTDGRVVSITAGAGNDTFLGGSGNDIFYFRVSGLTSMDRVEGNGGTDLMIFDTPGAITEEALSHVTGIERFRLGSGNNSIVLTDRLLASTLDGHVTIYGSSAAELVDASALTGTHAVTIYAAGGRDTLIGSTGADSFLFRPEESTVYRGLDVGDIVIGGDGAAIDRIEMSYGGTYGANVFAGVSGIELIELAPVVIPGDDGDPSYEPDFKLVLNDALVSTAHGGILHIVAKADGNDHIDAGSLSAPYAVKIESGDGTDILIGGAGADSLTGGLGADRLTGGGGNDIFAWATASEGGDTITDFTQGQDKLQFALDGFDINGAAFDRLVAQSGSTPVNIDDADLLLFGGTVSDTADLRAQLTALTTGADAGEGLFVAARTSDGHTHIFYTGDASGTIDSGITDIADLGATIAPSSLTINDFILS